MIKKIFFGLAAIIGLASCTGDAYTDWLDPQSSDAEDAKTVTMTVAQAPAVDFANISDVDNDLVKLFIPTVAAEEGAATEYVVTLFNDEGEAFEVTADAEGQIAAALLKEGVETLFGKAPETRNIQMDIVGYTNVNGLSIKNVATSSLDVTLNTPKIYSKYYLIGSFDGWTNTRVEGMELVNDGSDPYTENSKFSLLFEPNEQVLNDGFLEFKVVPDESFNDDGTIKAGGMDVALSSVNATAISELEGSFSYTNEFDNFKFDLVEDAIAYNITFDLIAGTYEIKPVSAAPQIWYLIGNCIGDGSWGNSFDNIGKAIIPMAYKGEKELVYTGFFKAGGQFKFVKTPGSWDEQMNYQNVVEGTDLVTDEDGNNHNIGIVEEGFYTITVNYAAETIAIAKADDQEPAEYEVLGMCGAFQDWKEKEADDALWRLTKMENNDHVWFATFTFDTDTEGKFLTDWSWTVNWGATEFPTGIGVQNGSNIPITAGTYVVVFNDITGGYNFISAEE